MVTFPFYGNVRNVNRYGPWSASQANAYASSFVAPNSLFINNAVFPTAGASASASASASAGISNDKALWLLLAAMKQRPPQQTVVQVPPPQVVVQSPPEPKIPPPAPTPEPPPKVPEPVPPPPTAQVTPPPEPPKEKRKFRDKLKSFFSKVWDVGKYVLPFVGGFALRAAMGSPLTFDLNGDGVKTSNQKVNFDINGDGKTESVSDISKGDGVLAFDANGNGIAGENGAELLGDNTDLNKDGRPDGFKDGFAALKGLAQKAVQEGRLNADALADNQLDANELATLEQTYGLRMKVGSLNSQGVSLNQAGVQSVNLSDGQTQRVKDFDGQGNDVVRQDGATFTRTNGTTGSYEDIFFKYKQ